MELLATVHWIMVREAPSDLEKLVAAVHAWGECKRRFGAARVGLAAGVLQEQGWVASGGPVGS